MDFFHTAVAPILKVNEGGYTHDPHDPGGETNHGITAKVARMYGYAGAMVDMTWDQALAIYEAHYFVEPGLDKVATIAPALAIKLCDIGVNQGLLYAGKFLQLALNAFNRRGKDYPDLNVDGDIADKTLKALRAYMIARKPQAETVLISAVRCLQGARYLNLADGGDWAEDYEFGWFANRVSL